MVAEVKVVSMFTKTPWQSGQVVVDTTQKSGQWSGLSPFIVGPCDLYTYPGTSAPMSATNLENAWQFAKVYKQHMNGHGQPTNAYWDWAMAGWADPKPHRYPMGKGAVPEYSLWRTGDDHSVKLSYINARKHIYAPLYAKAVIKQQAWQDLMLLYWQSKCIVLRDYDGYDHHKLGMSLTDVLNHAGRKMGHAFVLAMMLQSDPALDQLVF